MVQLIEGHTTASNDNNIKKLLEIEYYNGKVHADYIILFKLFAGFLIPLVALGYMHSKSVINDKIYFRISILIFVLIFFIAGTKMFDMYWRNKMDYDKYDRFYNNISGESIFKLNQARYRKKKNLQVGTSLTGEEEAAAAAVTVATSAT
jgi:hypothetical protein